MYCSIKTSSFVASFCLLFAGSVLAQTDSVEVVTQRDPVTIKLHSEGDSRFEFSGDNIIVAYWGGVEIEYFGYHIKAEDLRFNKAKQQGSVEGNVEITSEGLLVNCSKVILDAGAGQLTIFGPLSGSISNPQMIFSAGKAELRFEPGAVVEDMGDITVELSGSVSLETNAGMQFASNGFSYNGANAELSSMGPFSLEAASLSLPSGDGNLGSGITNLMVTGESLVGHIDPNGLLQSAEIRQLDIVSREVFLEAELATISAIPADGDYEAWELSVEGNPLTGGVHQERHDISFTTNSAQLAIGQHGLETLELVGGIDVELEDSNLHADRVNIERTAEGYKLSFPGTLVVNFDLFEMSGGELAEGGAIDKWLGS